MTKDSHSVGVILKSIENDLLEGAIVALTLGSESLSETTNSSGEVIFNTGNLSNGWCVGDSVTISAAKTGEGAVSTNLSLTDSPQTVSLTMAETSDYSFDKHGTNNLALAGALVTTYDGRKVTHANRFPIENQNPLDKYASSDEDVSSGLEYHGFLDKDGNWCIQKYDINSGTIRYVKGAGSYSTNWSNRSSLTYRLFSEVF